MNSNVYRWCAVPLCNNNSKKTPNKLFINVPVKKKVRDMWLKLARRDSTSISSTSIIYFCEDHFELSNDMENYMQYHVMGSVSQVRMRTGCFPTKFHCQPNRKEQTSNTMEGPFVPKKRILIEECEKDLATPTKHPDQAGTFSGNSVAMDIPPCAFKIVDMPETDIKVEQEIKIEDCDITPSTNSSEPSPLSSVKEEDFGDKYEHMDCNSSDSITDYHNDVNEDPIYIANFRGPQGRVFVFKKDRECHKIALPESVLPVLFNSGGPVCLDVPNVGCLQIKSPPIEKSRSGQHNLEEIKDEPLHDVEDSQNETTSCNEMSNMENNSKKFELPKMKKPTTTNRKPHRRKGGCKITSECSAQLHQMSKTKNNNKRELPNMTKVHRRKEKLKNTECSINQRSKRKIKNNRLNDYIYGKEKPVRRPTKVEKVIKPRNIPLQKDDVKVVGIITNLLKNEMNVNSHNKVLSQIMEKRISTCKELIDAFALIKPTLVLNEHNYKIVDYVTDYCKANIVYALNQNNLFPKRLLEERYFCDAVLSGFIKIVDSELLTDYLIGQIGPEKYKSHFISLDIGRD